MDPKEVRALRFRGVVSELQCDWEQALHDLDAALAIDPDEKEALRIRTLIRAACPDARYRDVKKAYADAKHLCDLTKWKDALAISALATVYAETGQFDEAVKLQKWILQDAAYAASNARIGQKRLQLYEQKKPYRLPER